MQNKIITSALTVSLVISVGLAVKDPIYIPLVASVSISIETISRLIKSDQANLPEEYNKDRTE